MSLYFALLTVENNKNKKSVKFQGDMLNYCDFIQVFVFTTNHHLKKWTLRWFGHITISSGLAKKMNLQGTVKGRRRGRQKMEGCLEILQPFQQYFSHIRMMGR